MTEATGGAIRATNGGPRVGAGAASAALDELVERPAVRPGDPLLGRAGARVDVARRVAERQDGREVVVLAQADRVAHRVLVGDPVRARSDTLVPGCEQHVLRDPPGVEGDRALAPHDDGD